MKKVLFYCLLSHFLLWGATAFAIPFNMINEGSDEVSSLSVNVTDLTNGGGHIGAEIDVEITGPVIGDILGIFGSLTQDVDSIVIGITGADITNSLISENAVNNLGGGNNMNGTSPFPGEPFDFGVTIGSQGMGGGDDFQTTSIQVLGSSIYASDFTQIGVRIQSVGNEISGRGGSAKYVGTPVPEPITLLLVGAGLAGLAGFRRKFKKR